MIGNSHVRFLGEERRATFNPYPLERCNLILTLPGRSRFCDRWEWSGSKLEKVIELEKDGTFQTILGGLSDVAKEFIDTSIAWRDRQIQEKLEAAEKLAEAETKARIETETRLKEQKKANEKLNL
jgi:hypothetical protein